MNVAKQIEQLFINYGVLVTIREIELINAITDLINRIVEAETDAAFDRGLAAEQLWTK